MTNNEILYLIGGALIGGIGINLFIANRTSNNIANNVDVDIPDSIIEKAATKAVKESVEETEMAIINRCAKSMEAELKSKVKSAYDLCEDDMKEKLLDRIDSYDIDDIKDCVIKEIMDNIERANRERRNDIPSIIRAGKDAGWSSWEIERIVKTLV